MSNRIKGFLGSRLRMVRHQQRLSLDTLSEMTGGRISKQAISRYEVGAMNPTVPRLELLCKLLEKPVDYFFRDESVDLGPMKFRTDFYRMPVKKVRPYEDHSREILSQYLAAEEELDATIPFEHPLQGFLCKTMADAEAAADQLRKAWDCGDGPILSLFRLCERKGVHIVELDTENIDGLSCWACNGRVPYVLMNSSKSRGVVRRRFTLGHELGHLLLTFPEGTSLLGQEKLCNRFAAALLMPRSTFLAEVGKVRRDLSLEEFLELNRYYGVSVACLVHRAFDLQVISRYAYDEFFDKVINKNRMEEGWNSFPDVEQALRFNRLKSRIENSALWRKDMQQAEKA